MPVVMWPNAKKLIALAILLALIGLALVVKGPSPIARADTTTFNALTDGIATNYTFGQKYGGKFGTPTPNFAFSLFIPTGSGFSTAIGDKVSLSWTKVGGGFSVGGNPTCTSASGGYNCSVSINTSQMEHLYNTVSDGEYHISFDLQHTNNTKFGKVVFNDGSDGGPIYSTYGTIYAYAPVNQVYADFIGAASTLTFSSKTTAKTYQFRVHTNSDNNPTSVDFTLDGSKIGTATSPSIVDAGDYYPSGKAAVFVYTVPGLDQLANGPHLLSATIHGSGYDEAVHTTDGQTQVSLTINYSDNSACNSKITTLNKYTQEMLDSKSKQFSNIGKIDTKLQAYFAKHPIEGIDNAKTLADIASKKDAADQANSKLLLANNFSCTDLSKQIDAFTTQSGVVHDALVAYRDALVSMIGKARQ